MSSGEVRDFSEIITDLRGGNTNRELSVAMHDATEAAKRTGKTASVQLTIKIKPQGDRQVEVIDAIKKTIPEPNRGPTIFFVDENNRLTRSDVRQMRIEELRVAEVKPGKDEVVLLNQKTGELKEVSVQ